MWSVHFLSYEMYISLMAAMEVVAAGILLGALDPLERGNRKVTGIAVLFIAAIPTGMCFYDVLMHLSLSTDAYLNEVLAMTIIGFLIIALVPILRVLVLKTGPDGEILGIKGGPGPWARNSESRR